jgi:hypothetical protein
MRLILGPLPGAVQQAKNLDGLGSSSQASELAEFLARKKGGGFVPPPTFTAARLRR